MIGFGASGVGPSGVFGVGVLYISIYRNNFENMYGVSAQPDHDAKMKVWHVYHCTSVIIQPTHRLIFYSIVLFTSYPALQ